MSIDTIEAADLAAWVNEYADRVINADVSPAMAEIGDILRRGIAQAFSTETGPDGPWRERKIDVGVMRGIFPESFNRPLLILSGDLIEAAAMRGPGAINRVAAQEITIGVDGSVIPYAASHQNSDRVELVDVGREIDIPARPYIYATTITVDKCQDKLLEFLVREVV